MISLREDSTLQPEFMATLLGPFHLPPYSTMSFQSLHQVGEKEGQTGKGTYTSSDYFLLIRDVDFLEASTIFLVRISATSSPATSNHKTATETAERGGSHRGSGSGLSKGLQHLHPVKSPQDSKRKLSAAGKNPTPPRTKDKSQHLWAI